MTVNDDYERDPEWVDAMRDHPLPEWLPAIERVDPRPPKGAYRMSPWLALLAGAIVFASTLLAAAWVAKGPPAQVDVRYRGMTVPEMRTDCDAHGGELIYDARSDMPTWTCEGVRR